MKFDPEWLTSLIADTVKTATAPLVAEIVVLKRQLAVTPRDGRDGLAGPMGVKGEVGASGAPGSDGATIAEAVVDAEGVLVLLMSDGRSIRCGKVKGADGAPGSKGEQGVPGRDGVGQPGPAGEKGEPGTCADVSIVRAEIAKAIADMPARDAVAFQPIQPAVAPLEEIKILVDAAVAKSIAAIPTPSDGKDADPEVIRAEVAKAIAALPAPKDGQDGQPGRDGRDADIAPLRGEFEVLTAALKERARAAEVAANFAVEKATTTLAAIGALPVPRDGQNGKDADPEFIRAEVQKAVDAIPRPKDGKDGKDGRDGTLEGLTIKRIDDRTFTFCFQNGDPIEGGTVKAPGFVYRNVYKADETYAAGDSVTHQGSMWMATADSQGRQPGTDDGAPFWRLCVKSVIGKQGPVGPAGRDGKDGRNGKDLTQMDSTGRKW